MSHYAAEPAPAPVVERRPEPKIEAPRPDAREALTSSGLQMVETTKKAPAPAPEPEPERLGRPRRERPATSAGEMVQVETTRK
jgi:hypothetical protein